MRYKESEYMLYLLSCALHGQKPEEERVAEMDLTTLYQLAKAHSVTGMCALALEQLWTEKPELRPDTWKGEAEKQLRRCMLMDMELENLLQLLEEERIWHMPLKGALLKDLYPKCGMRQMSDFDILYDPTCQQKLHALMKRCGYEKKADVATVDNYIKPPIHHIEFHRSLVGDHQKEWYDYYHRTGEHIRGEEMGTYRRYFSDEDFYVYMILHAYKHYAVSGTGVRILLDCAVYLKAKTGMDWVYIQEECRKLGIDAFEKDIRGLSLRVFGEPWSEPLLSEEQQEMLDYLMGSGTYGTVQNRFENKWNTIRGEKNQSNTATGLKYIWSRIFPDEKVLKKNYPFFAKHRWALPALWLFRLLRGIFFRRNMIKQELKLLNNKKTKE